MSEAYDYDDDLDDEDEDFGFDCGLDDEGQCSMAGTEDCDFECPHRDSSEFVGNRAWKKKHESGFPLAGCHCSACNDARRGLK